MVSFLKVLVITGVLVIGGFAVPDLSLAQECGECELDQLPYYPYDFIHRFTGGEGNSTCQSPPGHPIHDCENGDGIYWAYGPCHPPCAEDQPAEIAALLLSPEPLTEGRAVALLLKYPGLVSFNRADKLLTIRTCAGEVIRVSTLPAGVYY